MSAAPQLSDLFNLADGHPLRRFAGMMMLAGAPPAAQRALARSADVELRRCAAVTSTLGDVVDALVDDPDAGVVAAALRRTGRVDVVDATLTRAVHSDPSEVPFAPVEAVAGRRDADPDALSALAARIFDLGFDRQVALRLLANPSVAEPVRRTVRCSTIDELVDAATHASSLTRATAVAAANPWLVDRLPGWCSIMQSALAVLPDVGDDVVAGIAKHHCDTPGCRWCLHASVFAQWRLDAYMKHPADDWKFLDATAAARSVDLVRQRYRGNVEPSPSVLGRIVAEFGFDALRSLDQTPSSPHLAAATWWAPQLHYVRSSMPLTVLDRFGELFDVLGDADIDVWSTFFALAADWYSDPVDAAHAARSL